MLNINNKLNVGDTVRFLSTIGGGRVKGFLNKQLVIVEDEHGFDIPVLISECVVVNSVGNEKMGQQPTMKVEDTKTVVPPKPEAKVAPVNEPEETTSGEKITACLAYLPTDEKNLSTTAYECYFVNDSNYYLFFNYMGRENNSWKSRFNGLIEPNTKIFLEEFEKTALNEIEKICIQFIAFKHNKPFRFKNPCSVELRIDTVKFYKLHCFQENDYFDDNALIYYIIREDSPERELLVSAGDIEQAMKEKQSEDRRPRVQRIEKKDKNPILEIDLHINQLLDTTAGMDNEAMLNYQLGKLHEVMNENIKHKGQKIVFIHGKGDGVLKSAILKELRNKYKKCHYQDASFREYGFGATMVTVH